MKTEHSDLAAELRALARGSAAASVRAGSAPELMLRAAKALSAADLLAEQQATVIASLRSDPLSGVTADAVGRVMETQRAVSFSTKRAYFRDVATRALEAIHDVRAALALSSPQTSAESTATSPFVDPETRVRRTRAGEWRHTYMGHRCDLDPDCHDEPRTRDAYEADLAAAAEQQLRDEVDV